MTDYEATGLSAMGATFAERKAAREAADERVGQSDAKTVRAESDQVEDKAVNSASTKKRSARKKS